MRRVDRRQVVAPAVLTKKNLRGETEFDRAVAHFTAPRDPPGSSAPDFPFDVYSDDEVKERLHALFHGKCAYCESVYISTAPVDVEHYRPKGRIAGEVHDGYWWLAATWENLLPSCIDCNRRRKQAVPPATSSLSVLAGANPLAMSSGKQDLFPIAGARAHYGDGLALEVPVLLDPCIDDPAEHLAFGTLDALTNPLSLAFPTPSLPGAPATMAAPSGDPAVVAAHAASAGLSVRGAVSIQVYGLNRLGLVQDRTRVLRRVEFLQMIAIELGAMAETVEDAAAQSGAASSLSAVAKRLLSLQTRVLDEMCAMARPTEPYSEMVAAQLKAFKARIGT